MPLAAFLVQPDPPALAPWEVVLDAHGDDGADAGEGEGHHADQRPVAQPDHDRGVDAVQKLARLFGIQHGGLPGLHDMRHRLTHRRSAMGGRTNPLRGKGAGVDDRVEAQLLRLD